MKALLTVMLMFSALFLSSQSRADVDLPAEILYINSFPVDSSHQVYIVQVVAFDQTNGQHVVVSERQVGGFFFDGGGRRDAWEANANAVLAAARLAHAKVTVVSPKVGSSLGLGDLVRPIR